MTVGGPLLHIMPIMKSHRPYPGDPYFDYVTFLTEFHGRPDDDTTSPATVDQNIPLDSSTNNLPLFISGTPHRFPLDDDGVSSAPMGVSDIAAYEFDRQDLIGSAIVVGDCTPLALTDKDFEIHVRLRTTSTNAYSIAGRWKNLGGYSWVLDYYTGLNMMRFRVSIDGTHIDTTWGYCYFRLGSSDDGLTLAEFANNEWHDIIVSREGPLIMLTIDGHLASTNIDMLNLDSMVIYDPEPDKVLLNIGGIPATESGTLTASGNFDGQIKFFKMTIDGDVELDVNFNEYWSMWWVGHYPQSLITSSLNLNGETFQNEKGLKHKPGGYIGNYWPYDETLDFGSGDFTIELFDVITKFDNNKIQTIVGMGWPAYKCWRLITKNTGAFGSPGHLVFQYTVDNTTEYTIELKAGLISGVLLEPMNISISRFDGEIRCYINGQKVAEAAAAGGIYSGADHDVRLGFFANMSNAHVASDSDQVLAIRLTKGIGRYRGPFYRMPTLPLPKSTT
jgi:hypothetical protein